MYSMPGTPLTACSIGAATASAKTWALAPGYEIEIDTPGGVMRGYCASGRNRSAIAPISVVRTASTVAKIGRSMKKWEITPYFFGFFPFLAVLLSAGAL